MFSFEVKRWLNSWQFYLYFTLFFVLAFFVMAGAVGYFDNFTVSTASVTTMNSPLAINTLMGAMTSFINFIIPAVIGATVYRDYKYNMHHLIFAYPFNKFQYLIGKFLSGFIVTSLITLSLSLGFLAATALPFANPELLGPTSLMAYFQSYFLFVLPNIFFIGALVFLLVTLTRNQYIGFIFIIILLFIPNVISSLTKNVDDKFVASLFDPFGIEALHYITKYWTIEEQNNLSIPLDKVLVLNRLIWTGLGFLAILVTYFSFSFSHSPISLFRRKKGERITKNNFGNILKVDLPKVSYDYSFFSYLKTSFRLAKFDFISIIRNKIFITLMIFFVIFAFIISYTYGEMFGTKTYPVTWQIVEAVQGNISLFLSILIYLFAGILLNRDRTTGMNQLVDATAIPNWSLLTSKVIALILMTCVVLGIGVLTGISFQIYSDYYNFELGQYLKSFFGFELISYIIIIFFALFIQSFFKNYLVGFFAILAVQFIWSSLDKIGIEQRMFYFNSGYAPSYSDMNGFGTFRSYFYYKAYWMLFGFILFIGSLLFWRRGILSGAKERIQILKTRFNKNLSIPLLVFSIAFLSLGYALYYQSKKLEPYYSKKERELQRVDYENKYKKFEKYAQPRITDVKVAMDIYPEERNFKAVAEYIMLNKSEEAIDSIFVSYSNQPKKMSFDLANKEVLHDSVLKFIIYKLDKALAPGETIKAKIEVVNKSNTWLRDRSPIRQNGTFINNSIFPSFGYVDSYEIQDNTIREKYDLPERERMAEPTDMEARMNTYISNEADWINFETTVSTSSDQIAIAPGYLQKEWEEDGRKYFHYKMDQKMLNFYAYNSARYELMEDKLNDINLEIYYHKGHEYNLDRMMDGMKKSLSYYIENFGPYQHKQARIIEFPINQGRFAQAFANTMPFSEGIGFIAQVDEKDPDAVDYPFSVISHEIAHQWWAHQVIGAKVKGATLLSESLAQYSSLKVLEQEYGRFQMRKFLKDGLDSYLSGRTREWKAENPLMYNENQQYIHYHKGSLAMYAMSDYMGEKNFNAVLKEFVADKKFQEPPYTISVEFVELLKERTPDSLQYLITDMYETITLYDNKVNEVVLTELDDGRYQVDIDFIVSKYRTTDKGEKIYEDENGKSLKDSVKDKDVESYPLQDYIEIGVFGEKIKKDKYEYENELYNKKHLIDKINNTITIIVDEKPVEVGVDPYNKLIDRNSNDNRKKLD